MKKQKRKIFILISIVFILTIFLFLIKRKIPNQFQDELIFFKWFSSSKQEEDLNNALDQKQENIIAYNFQVFYKNIDFKEIDLADTIKQDTLVCKKIAPRYRRSI